MFLFLYLGLQPLVALRLTLHLQLLLVVLYLFLHVADVCQLACKYDGLFQVLLGALVDSTLLISR